MDGFYLADGWDNDSNYPTDITQKSKICVAGLSHILKTLEVNYKISIRKDKPNIQSLVFGINKNGKYLPINDHKSNRKTNEIWYNSILENKQQYVYDISTDDGTFIAGIGGIVAKNTDGVNFSAPKNRCDYTYVGKGLNELVVKDRKYVGVEADVAEFNDIFMRKEMGLDIDYKSPVCINISRKNYIIKMVKNGKEKIKLTGNTIKSKKLSQYVIDFLDEGFIHLLNGDGLSFVELYYTYMEKIFNKEIPLSKIANKARVKQSVADYKKHITKITKSGSLMSRQAHMELIIQNDYPAGLGDTIYYVNNGLKKSHGDVQKIAKTGELKINCYMISEQDIIDNPDLKGEYNVAKYLSNFNKRVEPLLVVFHPEIRHEILIEDPKDRKFFTKKQCELTSGFPLKERGQDNFDEVMTLSDSEVIFWNKVGKDPYSIYLEDSLQFADQHWINLNRSILSESKGIKNDEDDIIESTGDEIAVETVLDKD